MTTLEQLVQSWLQYDQNPSTRNEITTLWESGKTEELEKRLRTRIEFGTAGGYRRTSMSTGAENVKVCAEGWKPDSPE